MDSPHIYERVGLTPEVARLLYNDGKAIRDAIQEDYGEYADLGEYSFERYMITRVTGICEDVLAASDENDWFKAMTAAGIKQELQDSIMNPEFADIRGTQSLPAWIEEIFWNNFNMLKYLDEGVLEDEKDPSSKVPLKRDTREENKVAPPRPSSPPPPPPPGHRVLFKSVEFHTAQRALSLDPANHGEDRHTIDLSYFQSPWHPTNLLQRGGLYLTDTLWLAQRFAAYTRCLCPTADIRVIEVHVPEEHFKQQKVWELEFDDTLKEIVWNSRRGRSIPRRLHEMRCGFGILRAPCVTLRDLDGRRVGHWSEITAGNIVARTIVDEQGVSGLETAMMYMWRNHDAISQLNEDCEDKTYVRAPFDSHSY